MSIEEKIKELFIFFIYYISLRIKHLHMRKPPTPRSDIVPPYSAASEHAEAAMFMRAVRAAEAQWPELQFMAAIPNGGHRARRTAGRLKAEGVRPGMPDYLMPVRRAEHVGLAIELKTAKGRTSHEQRVWLAHLAQEGWKAVVARGWEQAWDITRDYLAADGGDGGPNEN